MQNWRIITDIENKLLVTKWKREEGRGKLGLQDEAAGQDERVGRELTFSYENTKITTNSWITTHKKSLEPTKKIPYIQKPTRKYRMVGGIQ